MVRKRIRRKNSGLTQIGKNEKTTGLESSFYIVDARQVPPEEIPGVTPQLSMVQERLVGIAREKGWSPAIDVCPAGKALLSRGIDGGDACPKMVDYTEAPPGDLRVRVQHLYRQQRSPKILFAQGGEHLNVFEMKIKGGGVRAHINMDQPNGKSSQFMVSKEGVTTTFQVNGRLMTRFDGEWMNEASRYTSNSLWGTSTRSEVDDEYAAMLGLHHLLMSIDGGNPAGAHIPLGVCDITEVPVIVEGKETSMPVHEFLTNTKINSIKDLNLLAIWADTIAEASNLPPELRAAITGYREALEANDPWFERRSSFRDSAYLSALPPKDIAGMEGARYYRKAARRNIKPHRGPAGKAMAGIFRLAQLQSVGGDDMRLQEFFDVVLYESESKEDIDTAMRLLYANYGEEYVAPDMELDINRIDRVFEVNVGTKIPVVEEYLRRVYNLNSDAADRILEGFTRNYFRDIGAVHGAGGYLGGMEQYRDPFSETRIYGARQGGAVEVRNTDILGCKHDLTDETYLPFLDMPGERPSDEIVREMQLKDLFIAEVTLGKFKTLMTGVKETEYAYDLSDNRSVVYTSLEPRGDTDRVAWVENRVSSIREGRGPIPEVYSDYWRRIQGTRDEVYDDYFERGRAFIRSRQP